ncbi:biotin--[acetyl-CoA-carboxylase] ligase [Acidiferrobacter sp.]|uniref:biotin--[acetyl-CoA-carboxylase] ligase n=1 Tax=Acidiferrobacter sp. TaxID=1872107 RepID=UPI00261CE074|nr:biotin--[acetyl-CoA-carboxylase] ligase [Acidiferrobacter sp.]
MTLFHQILEILADGERHSGVALARELGVSRAAVSKAVGLALADVPVEVGRRGYRLPAVFRPLNAARIQGVLAAAAQPLERLTICEEIESTNQALLTSPGEGVQICLAERQTAGRGRRGRVWQATPYGSVLLSVAWTITETAGPLGVISLAAGVAVARALESVGVPEAVLKWPNDVLWQARKLAGVLTELRGEAGAMRVVVGVGINVAIGASAARAIDQEWAELRAICPDVDRSDLAALVIAELLSVMDDFRRGRRAALLTQWRHRHAFADMPARIHEGQGACDARVIDVDDEGALIVEVHGKRRRLQAGDVSVRPL